MNNNNNDTNNHNNNSNSNHTVITQSYGDKACDGGLSLNYKSPVDDRYKRAW